MKKFDAIIIGAGQAGSPLAKALAKAGWRVALIEQRAVGGTCINDGCTPTKTMIASARVAHLVARAADFGVQTSAGRINLEQVQQHKNKVVHAFRDSTQTSLEETQNLELIYATASFTSAKQLELRFLDGSTQSLEAQHIFINTGTRPAQPKITGLADVHALDSTSLLELDKIPEHLMIIGAGYIALEFGQMFARFGARVTILEQATRILPHEDPDVAQAMQQLLIDSGIDLRLGVQIQSVSRLANQEIQLELASGLFTGSHLLLATGRVPNTERLNLMLAGITTDTKGYVVVDDNLQTNVPNTYALGDVKGGAAFTHIAYDDYRIVRDALLHNTKRSYKTRVIPYTVFTDPQLARVGMTQTQAEEQGLEVKVYKLPMTSVARAIETDETFGLMKVVVDAKTDLILGAAILGVEGGEVMSVLQMAMLGNVTASTIREMIFAHPTISESLNNLLML